MTKKTKTEAETTTAVPKRRGRQKTYATRLLAMLERRGGVIESKSMEALAKTTRFPRRSLYFAIARLEGDGLVKVTRTPTAKPTGSWVMALRLEVV